MTDTEDENMEGKLLDPSEMTEFQRKEALLEAVSQDDLLGVLLYMGTTAELNHTDSEIQSTVLQEAVTRPTRNFRARKFVVECLLHRGADPSLASGGQLESQKIVDDWTSGGREQAVASEKLLSIAQADLTAAEDWIIQAELGLEDLETGEAEIESIGGAVMKEEEDESHTLLDHTVAVKAESVAPITNVEEDRSTRNEGPSTSHSFFHSLPRPLPQPPSPVRLQVSPPHNSAPFPSAASSTSFFCQILHLPINLPQWKLHQMVVERIPATQIKGVQIFRNHASRYNDVEDATGLVEVTEKETISFLIDNFKDRPFDGCLLDAVAYPEDSSIRPPAPTRPRTPSASLQKHRSFDSNFSPSRSHSSRRRSRSPPRHSIQSSPGRRRVRSTSPSRPFDPAKCIWMIPTSWAQRRIYEELERGEVTPQHIILHRPVARVRHAYVAFASKSDFQQAVHVLTGAGEGVQASLYDPSVFGSETSYPPTARSEPRYFPPSEKINQRPQDPSRIIVKYIPRSVSRERIIDFIESRVGRHTIKELLIFGVTVQSVDNAEQVAEVSFKLDEDAIGAIKLLDGTAFSGVGVKVDWAHSRRLERQAKRDLATPPPRHSRSRSRSPRSNRRLRSSQRRLSNDTPPSPPPRPRSPSTQLAMDLSRIRSLNLSLEDLQAIERIWTPLEAPPPLHSTSTSTSTPSSTRAERTFNREVDVKVKFGFLPQSQALSALEDREPVFPDDAQLEKRYRSFLEAQAGVGRDHYTIFFAQLFDWNVHSEIFAVRGREVAERRRMRSREDEGNSGSRRSRR